MTEIEPKKTSAYVDIASASHALGPVTRVRRDPDVIKSPPICDQDCVNSALIAAQHFAHTRFNLGHACGDGVMSQAKYANRLDSVDAVDLVLRASGSKEMGRTALQKLVYFVSKRVNNGKIDFTTCYFGPYSPKVAANLARMCAFGQVYELPERMNGCTTYRYGLTPPGKKLVDETSTFHPQNTIATIQEIVDVCSRKCQLDTAKLAYAAKVHYAYNDHQRRKSSPPSNREICKVAGKFGWDMNVDNAKTGFELLESLGIDPR